MSEKDVQAYAKIIWDYMLLGQQPQGADCLVVLGNSELKVPVYAAELANTYSFKCVVFTGGIAHRGDFLDLGWNEPEADVFYKLAQEAGLPPELPVYFDREAQNTGDNVNFTAALLEKEAVEAKSWLMVTKPYMERRALATAEAQGPKDVTYNVTSPTVDLNYYLDDEEKRYRHLNVMIGDLQRIKAYPEKGWQSEQHIPDEVWDAAQELIKLGYDKHVLQEAA